MSHDRRCDRDLCHPDCPRRKTADLWETLPKAWDDGFNAGRKLQADIDDWYYDQELDETPRPPANPYRDGAS